MVGGIYVTFGETKFNIFWSTTCSHFPKGPNCEICKRAKVTRTACRRTSQSHMRPARRSSEKSLQQFEENCGTIKRHAIVVQDLATHWVQSYPCKTKTSHKKQRDIHVLDPEESPNVMYTDNSLEFGKDCEDLQWNHSTSLPYRPETNDMLERTVSRVNEVTSSILLKSGLDERWWAASMENYAIFRIYSHMGKLTIQSPNHTVRSKCQASVQRKIRGGSISSARKYPRLLFGFLLYTRGGDAGHTSEVYLRKIKKQQMFLCRKKETNADSHLLTEILKVGRKRF